jgi:glycosyltransferase involved in cell wall biosynthesis
MKKGSVPKIGNHRPESSPKDYPRKIGRKVKLTLKNLGIISNRQHRSFSDFSGFLANSLVSPMVYAPFREQDKRCFATMENITQHLTGLSLNVEDKSLVSIIMPVYNRIDSVKYAVDSVLEQSYRNIELIIIDDGSDDGSKELLENIKDQRIKLLHNKTCNGVSNARNQGLKAASGKYIAYLDSDNMWDSRYVAAMVGAFLKLPDADVLYGGQLLFKGNQKHPFAVRFGSFNRSLLINRNYIDLNALCHTYDLYKRIGGFDETLIRLVDYDLIMRMAETAQIYSVPVLLSHYYYEKAQNTITKIPGYVEYLEIVREKRLKRTKNNNTKIFDDSESNKLKHKVSIIIPSYEALEDIRNCIDSVLSINASKCLEIIVVDNSSSKPVVNYLEQLVSHKKIKLIKNDINYGFTYAVNQGLELAESDNDIVIMNNDAIITPGAIEALQKTAYEQADCGILVPQQVLPGDTKTIDKHVPYAYPEYECDVNLSAVHENIINVPVFHSGRVVELSFAPFFFVYIKRDVLNSSIGLDAEFGRHYRSDRIFCNYVRHMMNLKIYYVAESVVYHKLQRSTDVMRSKSKKSSNFDLMFHKNRWDDELASQFNYKTPIWDY